VSGVEKIFLARWHSSAPVSRAMSRWSLMTRPTFARRVTGRIASAMRRISSGDDFLARKLDQIRAAVAKLLRKDFRRAAMEVGRVNKSVKPAVRKRFHKTSLIYLTEDNRGNGDRNQISTAKEFARSPESVLCYLRLLLFMNKQRPGFSCVAKNSARLFKRHPPEPVAARGEPDQHILERRRQHEPLQPFGPGEPPGKRGIATAGDLGLGFSPGNFPATPRAQRIDGEFRRFEGHGHSVAGDGRDHGDGVADAAIHARDRPGWPQRKTGDGAKRVFIKFSRSQPLVQRRTRWSAQQFAPVLRPDTFAVAPAE